ncbi:fimbrial protein [Enterobacter sp. 22452]|uniref:fimbrial protein n=1 Tax=Enterobacter TaxID=547 RepID=UPI003F874ED3
MKCWLFSVSLLLSAQALGCHGIPEMQRLDIQLHPEALLKQLQQKKTGTVLYTHQATLRELTGRSEALTCGGRHERVTISGNLTGNELGRRVYQTSVPGIGVRIFYLNRYALDDAKLRLFPFIDSATGNDLSPLRTDNIALRIELVKTAETVHPEEALRVTQNELLRFSTQELNTMVNFKLISGLPPVNCSLDTPQVVVHLPTTPLNKISQDKNKPGTLFPLSVKILCDAAPHLMSLTISGDAADARTGVLNMQPITGSAKGIGLQFWLNNSPAPLNQAILLSSLPTQNPNGQLAIPLSLSYIRLQPDTTPGKVSAVATLQVNYL